MSPSALRSTTATLTALLLCACAPRSRAVAHRAEASHDPRAAIFVRRGCGECHAIAGLGVRAASDVGPDLTFAYADVVNRYGTTLEQFMDDPRGIMRMVLASHVGLSAADRDSITHVLHQLYNQHRARMDERIPSMPPGGSSPHGTRRATFEMERSP